MADDRHADLVRFYSLLDALELGIGGARMLADCSGRMDWPTRGVYFFREPGETRTDTGRGPRVVRVGTHALKADSGASLWSRLRHHKGLQGSGGGNHRASIFRLIVGSALIRRDGHEYHSWGVDDSASRDIRTLELPLEREVSKFIGAMPFLWLSVDDAPGPGSLRECIERNSIALLSNLSRRPIDPPSAGWLGHCCDRGPVRQSGLWNQKHVEKEYSPAFLDDLEALVAAAVGRP